MKEEIKEILGYYGKEIEKEELFMKNYTEEQLKTTFQKSYQRYKNHKILLDYITNLQEENEYSNYCNEELRKKITNLEYKIERLENELKGDNK